MWCNLPKAFALRLQLFFIFLAHSVLHERGWFCSPYLVEAGLPWKQFWVCDDVYFSGVWLLAFIGNNSDEHPKGWSLACFVRGCVKATWLLHRFVFNAWCSFFSTCESSWSNLLMLTTRAGSFRRAWSRGAKSRGSKSSTNWTITSSICV